MLPVVSNFVFRKINNLIVSDKWNIAIRILKKFQEKCLLKIFLYRVATCFKFCIQFNSIDKWNIVMQLKKIRQISAENIFV